MQTIPPPARERAAPRASTHGGAGGTPRVCGAFTLIELVMVLVIVGVTSAIAVPRFAGATQNHRVRVAAQRLITDLAMVQSRANMSSTTLTVTFAPGTGVYMIPGIADLKSGGNTYTTNLAERPFDALIVNTILGGTTVTNGTSQLSFNGFGAPSVGGTVTLGARAASITVAIDAASGKAQLQ